MLSSSGEDAAGRERLKVVVGQNDVARGRGCVADIRRSGLKGHRRFSCLFIRRTIRSPLPSTALVVRTWATRHNWRGAIGRRLARWMADQGIEKIEVLEQMVLGMHGTRRGGDGA